MQKMSWAVKKKRWSALLQAALQMLMMGRRRCIKERQNIISKHKRQGILWLDVAV